MSRYRSGPVWVTRDGRGLSGRLRSPRWCATCCAGRGCEPELGERAHQRENKWRAARYGKDAIIIRNRRRRRTAGREDLDELLPMLHRSRRRWTAPRSWRTSGDIVARGASCQRQLRVAAANDGSLKAVVSSLVRELCDGPVGS